MGAVDDFSDFALSGWLKRLKNQPRGDGMETKCEQKRFSNFHHVLSDVFPSFTTFQSTAANRKKPHPVPRCEKTPTSWLSPKERLLDILSFLGGNSMLRCEFKE